MKRRIEQASMTVEAVMILTILLLILIGILGQAITLYQQTKESVALDWVEPGVTDRFRVIELGKELLQ